MNLGACLRAWLRSNFTHEREPAHGRALAGMLLALSVSAGGCHERSAAQTSRGESAPVASIVRAASSTAAPAPVDPTLPQASGSAVAAATAAPQATVPPAPPTPQSAPLAATNSSVDLRPQFLAFGLPPRPQGSRGTCSVFTTCAALEFALAKQSGRGQRMSPEYLNWVGAKAIGRPSDGNFFHNALKGWEDSGLCAEALMPYAEKYDPARKPSAEAAADAVSVRDRARGVIVIHWIVPWEPNRFGVGDEQFAEVKATLLKGYPVAAGAGHSRLLVGYRDDPQAAGGGKFLTLDSALNRFDEVTFEFVRKDVADVFWVECAKPAKEPEPKR